jgi:hypothetical protein
MDIATIRELARIVIEENGKNNQSVKNYPRLKFMAGMLPRKVFYNSYLLIKLDISMMFSSHRMISQRISKYYSNGSFTYYKIFMNIRSI